MAEGVVSATMAPYSSRYPRQARYDGRGGCGHDGGNGECNDGAVLVEIPAASAGMTEEEGAGMTEEGRGYDGGVD